MSDNEDGGSRSDDGSWEEGGWPLLDNASWPSGVGGSSGGGGHPYRQHKSSVDYFLDDYGNSPHLAIFSFSGCVIGCCLGCVKPELFFGIHTRLLSVPAGFFCGAIVLMLVGLIFFGIDKSLGLSEYLFSSKTSVKERVIFFIILFGLISLVGAIVGVIWPQLFHQHSRLFGLLVGLATPVFPIWLFLRFIGEILFAIAIFVYMFFFCGTSN